MLYIHGMNVGDVDLNLLRTFDAILRELVLAGLPVSAFAEARENLHQSYLRTVARSGV